MTRMNKYLLTAFAGALFAVAFAAPAGAQTYHRHRLSGLRVYPRIWHQ